MRLIVLFGLFFSWACVNVEPAPIQLDKSKIKGYWEVLEAKRNGKSTGTLKDAFFKFSNSDKLVTNVLGQDDAQLISWRDSTFISADSSYVYKVRRLNQDTLDLSFTYMRYQFELSLVRSSSAKPLSTTPIN